MTRKEYLSSLKVGDKVTRLLSSANIPMAQTIWKIENNLIFTENHMIKGEAGWQFSLETGAEIDEELGWDGVKKTGSVLEVPAEPSSVKMDSFVEVMADKVSYIMEETGEKIDSILKKAKKVFDGK